MKKMPSMIAAAAVVFVIAIPCQAGNAVKWEEVPKPVREMILANGGTAGPIEKETESKNGKAVYDAAVKDKKGNVLHLVIAEDGTVIEIKTADLKNNAADRTARGKKLLAGVKFTHPTEIANPYLPLSSLKQDTIEGTEDGKKTRVERTAKPDLHKTFKIGRHNVEAFVVEDRMFEDDKLTEVAIDYFAQDDEGTVYYLGEESSEYKEGKVIGHEGSWMLGKDTKIPGVAMPAKPKVGDIFRSEDVSEDISEVDEIVSVTETVKVPAGTYSNCIKIKESLADGTTEYKYYAKGIGVIREVPHEGDALSRFAQNQAALNPCTALDEPPDRSDNSAYLGEAEEATDAPIV